MGYRVHVGEIQQADDCGSGSARSFLRPPFMCAYGCVLSKCESKAGDAVEEQGDVEGVGTEVHVIGAEGKVVVSVSP